MCPRRLRVQLLRKRVELRLGLLVCVHRSLGDRLVPGITAGDSGRIDIDVVAFAIRREELDPELVQQRVQPRLIRGDPLAAELVGLAAQLRVPEAAADPVARLEDDDVLTPLDQPRCRGEPGDPGAHDHAIGRQLACTHVLSSAPSAAAAAARPVRTAPSM